MGVLHIWLLPALSWAWGLLCIYGVIAFVICWYQKSWRSAALFLFLGLFWVVWSANIQISNQISTPLKDQDITVQIQGLVKSTSERHQILVNDRQSNQKYLLNLYSEIPVPWQSGDILQIKANLKPPHGTVNDTGFDRERWLFRQQISATGTIKSWQLTDSSSYHPWHAINRWRAKVAEQWQQSVENPSVRALLLALSIGDKSQFDKEDFKRFQDTGTAHLIAISGLHIGMMAAMGYGLGWLLFALWPQERLTRPQLQAISAWVMATMYATLAGLALPTLRAMLMLSIYLVFQLIKRKAYAWDVWCLSVFVMLLIDPLGVLDWGFFLSFGAVAVLIFTFQGVESNNRWMLWLKAQWVLLIGLMPFQLLVLGRLTWAAPLVNLIAIPFMTLLIVPLLFLVMLSEWLLGFSPDFLLDFLVTFCQWFYALLGWFEQLSFLTFDTVTLSMWQWCLLLVVLLCLLLPKVVPQKYWVLLLILPLFYNWQEKLPEGHFTAQFFDVGQGLAVAVHTRHHHLLYDVAAAYDSGFNWTETVIVPGLKRQGINKLDAVMISHQDNDHAGGWSYLQEQIEVDVIYGSTEHQIPCVKGVKWQWDEVTFEVLSPYNLTPNLKNNSSCVLKVYSEKGSLLLTGDIESAVEYRLTMQNEDLTSDVMLIPHHGSNTSSTESFISKVSPQWVINSSGKYNPFGHPTAEVLARYTVPIMDTQTDGQIMASTYPDWQFTRLRRSKPFIWRKP